MKRATWLVFSLAICAMLCLAPGAAAYAWFNDATNSYPASQDVSTSGSALTGADIPEGVYNITASTSSYMCKLSNVTATSAGGELWATFTMSGAYDALYLGTAEEAASMTNEDGTDVSAYYVTEPLEGYVARQFSLPIPALNEQITLATYSGGSKGVDGGMWYTRTVVFNSSSEVDDAIAGGGGDPGGDPGDDLGDDSGDDPGGSGDEGDGGDYDSGDSDGGDSQGDETPGDDATNGDDSSSDDTPGDSTGDSAGDSKDDDDDGEDPKDKSSSPAASKTPSGNDNDQGNSGGTAAGQGEEGSDAQDEPSDEEASDDAAAKAEAENSKGGGARIREIKFAGNQVVELGEGEDPESKQRQEEARRSEAQNAGAVAAGTLGALNVALAGAYVFGLKRARPKAFAEVLDKMAKLRRK